MSKSALAVIVVLLCSPAFAGDEPTKVRVASISFEPVKLDLTGNTKKLEASFRKAAAGGAKIAVAPEGILEGYVVNQVIAGDISAEQLLDVALPIDSPTIRQFQLVAKELDMCLVFGFAERLNDEVFNSAIFIDNSGQISGSYHKMQLAEGYDPNWWFNRLGKQSRAFDTPYGRCGILICNDRWNPLLAKIPALDGAQFLVIPSFGSTSEKQDEAVLSRGKENHLPIIEANVGVTLIVNDDEIVAVDRKRDGVTFADIVIPAARERIIADRDRVEAEFIAWREREMPARLARTKNEIDPRGTANDKDFAVLNSDELEVVIGNNKSLDRDGKHHRAGYNGIFSIKSKSQPESPFVPAYAGLNLEHYFDGSDRKEAEQFFEPRYSPMKLSRIDDHTVELHQPKTSHFEVESWTRFSVASNHIDFAFRCKPHREDYNGNFLGTFWASYINGPLNKSVYFLDAKSSLQQPSWQQLCTHTHNRDSTITNVRDAAQLEFEAKDTLFSNISAVRYSAPFFYGRFRNMVLIYVFNPNPKIRFSHSPSGGGISATGDDTNPAWDFQLIIPKPKVDREYELNGRLIYKEWKGRDDVLREVDRYLEKQPWLPVTLNEKADGYRGIWYMNQPSDDEYIYKYSGGLGTYCAKHKPFAIYSEEANKTFFCYGGEKTAPVVPPIGTRANPRDSAALHRAHPKDLPNEPEKEDVPQAAAPQRRKLVHMVSYFDHDTGTVPKPTLVLDKETSDAHDNPVISLDDNGHIWIFSTSHGRSRPSYIHRSKRPFDIDEFELIPATRQAEDGPKPIANFSYMQVWHSADGFDAFFTRYLDPAPRTLCYMHSKDGKNWSDWQRLATIEAGHYQVSGRGESKIGSMFNYHPKGRGLNWRTNLYYVESSNHGKTWQTVDGQELSLPLNEAHNEAIVMDYETQGLNVYLKDLRFDPEDRPVLLYITSKGYQSGPVNDPRTWRLARWTGKTWKHSTVTTSDNNYDMGELWMLAADDWRVVAPTEQGPQPYNPGGEVAMWQSKDQGATWNKIRQLTNASERNHTYVRRALNAHPDFIAMWADGHGRKPSESRLYFANSAGDVFQLPAEMTSEHAHPVPK